MTLPTTTFFELQALAQSDEVVDGLENRFRVRRRPPVDEDATYFDTFDWRLDRAGGALRWSTAGDDRALAWLPRNGGRPLRERSDEAPPFATQLPDGPLREIVAPVAEGRRLLPVIHVASRTHQFDLLDDEEKTVARLFLDERRVRLPGSERNGATNGASWTDVDPGLRIERIRGYDDDYQQLQRYVEYELGLRRRQRVELPELLSVVGQVPGGNPSKLDIEIDPEMPADEAMRRILLALLEGVAANVQGALAQLDTEFLHDLRVAGRRTRSLLTQVKGVFPTPIVQHYTNEFRWLGEITGPVRDLDVLFEELDGYRSELGKRRRDDLAPLVARLFNRHRAASATMRSGLESERFADLVMNWSEFLDAEPGRQALPRFASMPIADVAEKRIRRAHKRLLQRGRGLTSASPDEDLHRVRIQAKKLRYLLETFRRLYPKKKVNGVVRSLKGIQDVLGEFNDLSVHGRMLEAVALELAGASSGEALLATGHLCSRLEDRSRAARGRFEESFARFAAKDSRRLLAEMLEAGA